MLTNHNTQSCWHNMAITPVSAKNWVLAFHIFHQRQRKIHRSHPAQRSGLSCHSHSHPPPLLWVAFSCDPEHGVCRDTFTHGRPLMSPCHPNEKLIWLGLGDLDLCRVDPMNTFEWSTRQCKCAHQVYYMFYNLFSCCYWRSLPEIKCSTFSPINRAKKNWTVRP